MNVAERLEAMGFKSLPPSHICRLLAMSREMSPQDLSHGLGNYMRDNKNDVQLKTAGRIKHAFQLDKQVENFFVGEGENADGTLACHIYSRLYHENVHVYHPDGSLQEIPQGSPFKKTVSMFRHEAHQYSLLVPNCFENGDKKDEADEDAAFAAWLLEEGFRIVDVPGDGNCMFTCISLAGVKGRQFDLPKTIREEIADFLRANINDENVIMYCLEDCPTVEQKLAKFYKIETDQNDWGDDRCIYAAHKLYNININVYMKPRTLYTTPTPNDPTRKTLNVSYHNNNHYNFLEPLSKDKFELPTEIIPPTRRHLSLYVILVGKFKGTIGKALENASQRKMYILLDLDGSLGRQLVRDKEMRQLTTAWHCQKKYPGHMSGNEKCLFLAEILAMYLFMTVLRVKWMVFEPVLLFNLKKDSPLLRLLCAAWPRVKETLRKRVTETFKKSHNLIHSNCSEDCPYSNESWHLNLAGFKRIQFEEPNSSGFMTRTNFLSNPGDLGTTLLNTLVDYYWSANSDDVDVAVLLNALNAFDKSLKPDNYTEAK